MEWTRAPVTSATAWSISSRRQYYHLPLGEFHMSLSAPKTPQRLRRQPEGTGHPRSVARLRPDNNSSQKHLTFTSWKRLSTHAFRWYGKGRRMITSRDPFIMTFVRGNCRLLTVEESQDRCAVGDLRARLLLVWWSTVLRGPSGILARTSGRRTYLSHLSLPPLPPPVPYVLLSS